MQELGDTRREEIELQFYENKVEERILRKRVKIHSQLKSVQSLVTRVSNSGIPKFFHI